MQDRITVLHEDVLKIRCDVLVLKYAQGFYGVDAAVAITLRLTDGWEPIRPGDYRVFVPSAGTLGCRNLLFLGTPDLESFSYGDIRNFGKTALRVLPELNMERSVVAMTMHGVGFGLDEREAFTAQVAGILEYFSTARPDQVPERVLIVESGLGRFQRMEMLLAEILDSTVAERASPRVDVTGRPIPDAGVASDSKRLVFVAMPYTEQMEDVFEFGIKEPVNSAGCLCERCDREVFVGNVLDRIKNRIAQSDVVVADMTGCNPNVYLEVGYAWGRGVQTLLIAREGEDLKFDVKNHRCIFYKNINHLRKQLTDFMVRLLST